MIFALLAILSFALQNTCCKEYGNRYPKTLRAQAAMVCVSLTVVALIMAALGGARPMTARGFALALAFGVAFVATIISMTLAMNLGHMGLTLLIQNSSLMVPTLYGVWVWGEEMTLLKGVGVALILLLLALSAGAGDAAGNVENWDRKKWLLATGVSFIGDCALAILQGMMARECASVSSETFTFWTSVFSVATGALILVFCRLRGRGARVAWGRRDFAAFSGLCAGIGVGTAGGNCLSILALTQMPATVLFPLRQGGLVLLMWAVGVLAYREKADRRGWIMLAVGLTGLVLLNAG